jgi:FkbM family methyltransferase
MKSTGELAVDVGANLGFYTVLMSSKFKRVIAVEPNPAALQILTLYLSYKDFANVNVLPVAIGDAEGVAELTIPNTNPFGAPSIIAFHGPGRIIEVKQTTLDKLLERELHIDLIKIDIEGAEFLALHGAKATLRKVETLIVELHDDSRRVELQDFLEKFGFKWKWLDWGHIVARKHKPSKPSRN